MRQRKSIKWCAAAWAACLLTCIGLTSVTDYHVHDADSRLYAAMAGDLAQRPVRQWCAHEWNGHWNRQGLFYEHPAGLLWAGALLIRAGVGSEQALYILNFLTMFMSLGLLFLIAEHLAARACGDHRELTGPPDESEAWSKNGAGFAAVGLWMLTPAFVQYLVRGNQEHPLGFATLLGMFALVAPVGFSTTAAMWAFALVAGLAVKGIAGLALLPVAVVWLNLYKPGLRRASAFATGCIIAGLAAWAYDAWAQQVTGASFWQHYLAGQVRHSVGDNGWGHKIGNLLYYTARPVWFGFPAVALLIANAARGSGRDALVWPKRPARAMGLLVAIVFVAGFSLANRKADRYIFSMYPALALAAADVLAASQRWLTLFKKWRPALPYALMLSLVFAVALKVYVGTYHYHYIRWWPGN